MTSAVNGLEHLSSSAAPKELDKGPLPEIFTRERHC